MYDIYAARVVNLIIAGLSKDHAIIAVINCCSHEEINRDILESHYLLKLFN